MLSTSHKVLAALTLVTVGLPAAAQAPAKEDTPRPRSPLVVRIGVDLVQVDAVVTDKKGRHVTDLTADDFEILQDNKPRPVTHCRYVVAETAPLVPRGVASADVPPPEAAALRPEDVKRAIAFVVDDVNLSPAGMADTRKALRKLVEDELRMGDLVAIVRTGGGMGILQQFTNDRRVLEAAVDDLKYNTWASSLNPFDDLPYGDRVDGPFDSRRFVYGGGVNESESFWNRVYGTVTLNAVTFVLDALRELPGRKSVVVLSERLTLYDRSSVSDPEMMDATRRVTDLANRSSVVIYTVDPGGLRTTGVTAAMSSNLWPETRYASGASQDAYLRWGLDPATGAPPFSSAAAYGRLLQAQTLNRVNSHSGLDVLARQTGGLFFPSENRVHAALDDLVEDQKGYYVIGYTPDERTFARSKHGPLFHGLKVRVKREGLQVRTRAGFVGIPDEEAVLPVPRRAEDRLLKAMVSPFAASDVPMRLTAVFGHDPRAGYVVHSMLHVDGSRLTFTPSAGGNEVKLDLAAAVIGDNGVVVEGRNHEVSFRVPDAALERVKRAGFLIELDQPLDRPGAYQFRVGLRDTASTSLGTANQFVYVPDLSKHHLALSGIVLGSRAPEATAEPPSAVSVAVDDEARMSPAVRRFRAGADVAYAFAVYNPATDRSSGQPQLGTRLRLVRNGREVLAVDAGAGRDAFMPVPAAGPRRTKGKVDKVRGFLAAGTLRLPPSLEPGEYALQLVVTDQLTRDKERSTGQWTSFEVLGEPQAHTSSLW
jgi:VWFA-related protein